MVEDDAARRPWFYPFASYTVRVLLSLFSRWRVIGAERMPATGPLLVVSNHVNNADPLILIGTLPRTVNFLAKEELFRFPLTPLTRGLGSIRVRRGQSDREAIRTALTMLERGAYVGVFPEGTRSKTGGLIKAQTGAGLLAIRSGAPILPVAVVGTAHLSVLSALLRRPKIDIIIGEPFTLPPHEGGGRAAAAAEATEIMMSRIAMLLPPQMRGVYLEPALAGEGQGTPHS